MEITTIKLSVKNRNALERLKRWLNVKSYNEVLKLILKIIKKLNLKEELKIEKGSK